MAEADGLPLCDQICSSFGNGTQQGGIGIGCLSAVRVMLPDHVIGQRAQRNILLARGKVFEMTETDEAGGKARDHGGSFHLFAVDRIARTGQAQRARCGDAERLHGLGRDEFADRRAQYGTAVPHAGIGRQAAALELDFLQRAIRGGQGAQRQGAAIAQLPGPHSKLVAAVDAGPGPRTLRQGIAGKQLERIFLGQPGFVQTEVVGGGRAMRNPVRACQRHRVEKGDKGFAQGTQAGLPVRMRRGRGRLLGHGPIVRERPSPW